MKKEDLAVVFDWDDVVFNTAAFKKGLAVALAKKGISQNVVLETVGIAKDAHGYNPAIHARMILSRIGRSAGKAAGVSYINRLIWTNCRALAGKLLFPDAVRTIRAAHKSGVPLYVLSAGRRQFQKTRIYGSGLVGLFRGIHIVDVTSPDAAVATKAKVLARLARRHKKLIFLDDRPKTVAGIREVRGLQGKVLCILVWYGKEKPPRGPAVIRRLSWKEVQKVAVHSGFKSY